MNRRHANPPRVRVVAVPRRPSRRLLRACAAFGLALRREPARAPRPRTTARAVDPGAPFTLILGPSGSGKSSLLRDLARRARGRSRVIRVDPRPLTRSRRPLLELFRAPAPARLVLLAAAGLAEPALLARPARELSDGQRARAALALALGRARAARRPLVLIDEFTSGLDRDTARSLTSALARWSRANPRVRIVAACARDEPAAWAPHARTVRLDDHHGVSP